MKNIFLSSLIGICLIIPNNVFASPGAYNARCTLVIDGKTYLNGLCSYLIYKDFDGFDDLRTKAICPNGIDYGDPRANCSMADLTILSNGYFGSIYRSSNGVAEFCWNGGGGMHAQDCYQGLTRKGACWRSDSAISPYSKTRRSIELCAWKL